MIEMPPDGEMREWKESRRAAWDRANAALNAGDRKLYLREFAAWKEIAMGGPLREIEGD